VEELGARQIAAHGDDELVGQAPDVGKGARHDDQIEFDSGQRSPANDDLFGLPDVALPAERIVLTSGKPGT
jgi:hypothetical protein